jgi:hypothetical protein
METKKAYRHGEILLVKIDNLPSNLKEEKTKLIVKGSHGHDHTFDNGKIYFSKENDYVFGYLEAKNTKLFHDEHSPKGVLIEDGLYELRKQQEFIDGELKQVID